MSTIIRCDLCKKELSQGEQVIVLSFTLKGRFPLLGQPSKSAELCEGCKAKFDELIYQIKGGVKR